jgi:hypothetical protein
LIAIGQGVNWVGRLFFHNIMLLLVKKFLCVYDILICNFAVIKAELNFFDKNLALDQINVDLKIATCGHAKLAANGGGLYNFQFNVRV